MKPEDKERFLTHLASLHAHLQKELKLKEKPKVFLASDQKNAVKVLGGTAHYEPSTKTIKLYITDRHPKDILRSYAHEVVHHWQHEHKQLGDKKKGEDLGPQYAQKDPWMRQMEKQAYLLGNILFRDWEDQKKADDKKTGKKVNEKTMKIGTEYPPRNPGPEYKDINENVGYYAVWRKNRQEGSQSEWILTSHTIEARSDEEAQSKLRRRFFNSEFSLMSLIAMPTGRDPNKESIRQ